MQLVVRTPIRVVGMACLFANEVPSEIQIQALGLARLIKCVKALSVQSPRWGQTERRGSSPS